MSKLLWKLMLINIILQYNVRWKYLCWLLFYCDETPCSRQFAEGLVDLDRGIKKSIPITVRKHVGGQNVWNSKLRAHILTQAGSREQAGSASSVWAQSSPQWYSSSSTAAHPKPSQRMPPTKSCKYQNAQDYGDTSFKSPQYREAMHHSILIWNCIAIFLYAV